MTFELVADPVTFSTIRSLQKMPKSVERGMRKGAYISGKELVKEARDRMNDPKTGRRYKINRGRGGRILKKPRTHIASNIDEAPAVITGDLRKSVGFKVLGKKTLIFGAGNRNVKYARILELGGSTGRGKKTKIEGRFYLRNATKKLGNKVKINIRREVIKQIRKS
jgi:phage gpG-like protein